MKIFIKNKISKMGMNKKGENDGWSNLVTILIIIGTLLAVAIIWFVIIPAINKLIG